MIWQFWLEPTWPVSTQLEMTLPRLDPARPDSNPTWLDLTRLDPTRPVWHPSWPAPINPSNKAKGENRDEIRPNVKGQSRKKQNRKGETKWGGNLIIADAFAMFNQCILQLQLNKFKHIKLKYHGAVSTSVLLAYVVNPFHDVTVSPEQRGTGSRAIRICPTHSSCENWS